MRENMLQQKEEGLATLAALGRNEDTHLAHVAPDEMIVPAQVLRDNPLLKTYVLNSISKYGVDPNKYIVGNGDMDLNPLTGLPEFGFLSKVFKKIKKVVKKVAPVAAFIPGVGTALGTIGGSLASKVGLGKVASGIGSVVSKIPGLGGAGGALSAAGATNMPIGAALRSAGTSISTGIGSLFEPGSIFRRAPGDQGQTPQFIKTIGNQFGFGGRSQILEDAGYSKEDIDALRKQGDAAINAEVQKVRDSTSGSFFGQKTPQAIKGIEDTAKGLFAGGGQNQQSGIGGLFGGLAGGNLTIPALYGLASYYGAKRDEGGLAATPATTMDQLGRYQIAQNLGTGGSREDFGLLPAPKALKFAEGGVAELDMRQGGESAGPGTGTSDDIPAMLSDGEFVMTAKATRGAGAYKVKTSKGGIELVKTSSPSREAGVKNMRKLMKTFEAI